MDTRFRKGSHTIEEMHVIDAFINLPSASQIKVELWVHVWISGLASEGAEAVDRKRAMEKVRSHRK